MTRREDRTEAEASLEKKVSPSVMTLVEVAKRGGRQARGLAEILGLPTSGAPWKPAKREAPVRSLSEFRVSTEPSEKEPRITLTCSVTD